MILPNAPTSRPSPTEAEHDLIVAIFLQALKDLKSATDPYAQASARRFWRGDAGDLLWFCEALGLDMAHVQAQIRRRYPEAWAPRQLELALPEAS